MKKQFTTAFMMAAAIVSAQAQVVLDYDGGIENAPDTVNWYGTWVDAGGTIEFGYKDGADKKSVNIYTPEEAGTANNWERVLKFDGLQIKPNTIYRVRLTATCSNPTAPVNVALMCGDENCDMQFVAPDGNGGYAQFAYDVQGWEEGEFATKTAMFYYTSDEYQQEIYPNIKPGDTEGLKANRFLRLAFKGTGEYTMDGVVVEEAKIAGVYFNKKAIKIDFGFPTNGAALAKTDALGTKVLDASLVKVTIDGEEETPASVEIKSDGVLYIFLDSPLEGGEDVKVSFSNNGVGLVYNGALTPGDGTEVVSFEAETAQYDETLTATSVAYEPAEFVIANPQDGSFEMDNDIKEFSFTFNKAVYVCGENAPSATLYNETGSEEELVAVEQENELGTTVIFRRAEGSADLPNGTYTIIIPEESVLNAKGVPTMGQVRIDFEVGKVKVAEIEYTPYGDPVWMDPACETDGIPAGWTCKKEYTPEGEEEAIVEEWLGGTSCRAFKFSGKAETGFYICDRDDARWTLTYGDKEDAKLHLPAGDVDFGLNVVGWQGKHPTVEYTIYDLSGNPIATGKAAVENTVAAAGDVISVVDRISTTINLKSEGDFILEVHNTNGISDGAIILGYDVKTFKMSAGVSSTNEVIINEDFADVQNGYVPAAGLGWNIYDNMNVAEKGVSQSGRNRVMDLGSCTNMTRGFYNRCFGEPAAYCMTYGEDGIDEPELELEATKYNFSWYACNWKGDENTYYFAVYDADSWDSETLTGDAIYEREDIVHANVNGGNQSATAEKIEFSFTPAKAGRYILKWWMTGESEVGKIKIEKMGSLAAFYRTMLNDAVADARAERANAEDEMYAGTTRDRLDQAIEEASHPDFHTGAEYLKAIEVLKGYVDAMVARRAAMAEYATMLDNCAKLLYGDVETGAEGLQGTKYEGLDAYAELVDLYNTYKDINPSTLEDEELLPVQTKLSNGYNYCNNMKNSVVALYTTQINRLAEKIAMYDVEGAYAEHDDVLAAGNALSDDQALAVNLQKILTSVIYQRLAEGNSIFEIYDEEWDTTEPTSVDLTGYIQNADVYTMALKGTQENIAPARAMEEFPGWKISGGNINACWGWDTYAVTETKPAEDQRFATPWGGSCSVEQTVNNLPVGIYTYSVDTGDGSHISEYDEETGTFNDGFVNKSSIYYTIGEEKTSVPFNLASSNPWRGMAADEVENIALPAGEHNLASITIGADMAADGDFANVDNFRLYLTAAATGFDYAAAAAALKQEIADAIVAPEERSDAPVSVVYYNVAGQKGTQPKGVAIKVERWADGYMRVSKTLKK